MSGHVGSQPGGVCFVCLHPFPSRDELFLTFFSWTSSRLRWCYTWCGIGRLHAEICKPFTMMHPFTPHGLRQASSPTGSTSWGLIFAQIDPVFSFCSFKVRCLFYRKLKTSIILSDLGTLANLCCTFSCTHLRFTPNKVVAVNKFETQFFVLHPQKR